VSNIDKQLTLRRYYDSASLAKLDAAQFVNDPEAIAGSLPKPGQWKVKVRVKRVTVLPSPSAVEPTCLELEVIVTGEEPAVDRWVQEHRSLHDNRGLSRRQEAEQFQKALKGAQGQAKQ